jgi:hypothetical protein
MYAVTGYVCYVEAVQPMTYMAVFSFDKVCSTGVSFNSRKRRYGHAPLVILHGHSRAVLRSFRLFRSDLRNYSIYRNLDRRIRDPNHSQYRIRNNFPILGPLPRNCALLLPPLLLLLLLRPLSCLPTRLSLKLPMLH